MPQPRFHRPDKLRQAIRSGSFTDHTAGHCPGYVQANLVILPRADAEHFAEFCRLNPRPCPLIAQGQPGQFELAEVAAGADLRTDVSGYCVFRQGVLDVEVPGDVPTDIRALWRDDLVVFLLGCSFTFENALVAAGHGVRHLEEGRNVPMYATAIPCRPAGRFAGNMVVSMRPFRPEQVDEVEAITACYPRMHGAPVHVGDPTRIGIADLTRPDFGETVTVHEGEVPVFWACGVTPQLAILEARPELAITHSPGRMFVTDLRDETFCESPGET